MKTAFTLSAACLAIGLLAPAAAIPAMRPVGPISATTIQGGRAEADLAALNIRLEKLSKENAGLARELHATKDTAKRRRIEARMADVRRQLKGLNRMKCRKERILRAVKTTSTCFAAGLTGTATGAAR